MVLIKSREVVHVLFFCKAKVLKGNGKVLVNRDSAVYIRANGLIMICTTSDLEFKFRESEMDDRRLSITAAVGHILRLLIKVLPPTYPNAFGTLRIYCFPA
jgi:hypothetical protein